MAARGSGARRAQGHKDAMLERVRAWPTRAFATPGTVNTASQSVCAPRRVDAMAGSGAVAENGRIREDETRVHA